MSTNRKKRWLAGLSGVMALCAASLGAPGVAGADTASSASRVCPASLPDASFSHFVVPIGGEKRAAEGLPPAGNTCTAVLSKGRAALKSPCKRGDSLTWMGQRGFVEAEQDSFSVRVTFRVSCAELVKRCYDFPQKVQPLAWSDNTRSNPPSCGAAFGPVLKNVCKPGWSVVWGGARGRIVRVTAANVTVKFSASCARVKELGPKAGFLDKFKTYFRR